MYKKIFAFVLFFFSMEAHLSQVDAMSTKTTLEDLVQNSEHILVVSNLNKRKTYKEVKFPKENHYAKKEETVYREYIDEYKIEEVLYSKTLKKDQNFWVWQMPNYNEYVMRMMHEEGVLESPFVFTYKSKFEVKGNKYILFLYNMENALHEKTYENREGQSEGLEGTQLIKDLLKKRK
ncbi:MAG: hypothetical protein H6622_05370 [Halobacteriovoraceae bacterium]|nr:hypothetical protein [Halobacteriovoraceae bacterium]